MVQAESSKRMDRKPDQMLREMRHLNGDVKPNTPDNERQRQQRLIIEIAAIERCHGDSSNRHIDKQDQTARARLEFGDRAQTKRPLHDQKEGLGELAAAASEQRRKSKRLRVVAIQNE